MIVLDQLDSTVGFLAGFRPWSPRRLGLTFDLDPAIAAKLTLVTSNVQAVADAAGGALTLTAPSSGQRPAYDTTHTANGRPCVALTNAANTKLFTTSGGITVNAAHHLAVVARLTGYEASYAGLAAWGQESAGTSHVGAFSNADWWAGGNTFVNPAGGTPDTSALHLISKSSDGTTTTLRVDGEIIATATVTYNLAAGLGVTGWIANTIQSAYLYRGLWLARALELSTSAQALADRRRLERYLATTYGLAIATRPLVQCVGDSLTYGTGSSNRATLSYPAQLATALGSSVDVSNLGVFGRALGPASTSSTMLNVEATQELARVSGCRPANVIVLFAASNDIREGRSAAACWADVQTYCAAARAAGSKVVLCTTITRGDDFSAGVESVRVAFNALVRAGAASICDALVDLDGDARLQNSANLTYFDPDTVHLTDAGFAVVASLVAPAVSAQL